MSRFLGTVPKETPRQRWLLVSQWIGSAAGSDDTGGDPTALGNGWAAVPLVRITRREPDCSSTERCSLSHQF